jgi:predicted molibdopterin-dependent oxidoreductase YjgC
MGALPNVYPGYQKVTDPAVKAKFESAWNSELSGSIGLTHVEIFDAIYEGKINALYLVGENPLLTEANANHVEEALEKLDFLVVQDIFMSETARYADVVLPAASGFAGRLLRRERRHLHQHRTASSTRAASHRARWRRQARLVDYLPNWPAAERHRL